MQDLSQQTSHSITSQMFRLTWLTPTFHLPRQFSEGWAVWSCAADPALPGAQGSSSTPATAFPGVR